MKKTKLDSAWESLFEKFNIKCEIENNGHFLISADQIKDFREPRLMTKFDHYDNLPKIFKDNDLSIMPISRNLFIISNHEMFFDFDFSKTDAQRELIPEYIESISGESITSEAVALNCSYLTGMLSDFLEDDAIVPTVSGRMGSGSFTFNIKNKKTNLFDSIDVNNSQIEIDGAYEGLKYLSLVEAKKDISSDFLIRQIYYPYRVWRNRVDKEIKLVYFIHSNSIFSFYEYKFEDIENYNSLKLVKHKQYTLEDTTINMESIIRILSEVSIIDEPEVPFPQADDFNKVINLIELIENEDLTVESIAEKYEFDPRQSGYYSNACIYLGLIDKYYVKRTTYFRISELGRKLLNLSYIDRQLEFVKLILSHKVFNETMKSTLEDAVIPDKEAIISLMKRNNLYNIGKKIENPTTYGRRASSIRGWIDWIFSIINE